VGIRSNPNKLVPMEKALSELKKKQVSQDEYG
jgi:hypothetical protein